MAVQLKDDDINFVQQQFGALAAAQLQAEQLSAAAVEKQAKRKRGASKPVTDALLSMINDPRTNAGYKAATE